MKTTNLFVELIVTGAGVLIWISLFVMAFFGYNWVPWNKVFTATGAIPILSFVYVLGIIIDRVADVIFFPDRADDNRREIYSIDYLKSKELPVDKDNHSDYARKEYYKDKIQVMENPSLADTFEYNKSRQRVSRGWAFNLVLILIAYNCFVCVRLDNQLPLIAISFVGSFFIILFFIGCLFSWINLNKMQYGYIKQQAKLLREKGAAV